MKILIACEFSGTVRDAFAARGHEAWSCDFEETEKPGLHLRGNAMYYLTEGWDMLIAFPPCTHLCSSGALYWRERGQAQSQAIEFFMELWRAPIPRIAIENPVGIMSTILRKPDQIIQPWEYGHGESKATCLWLKGLPKLQPTDVVEACAPRVLMMPASAGRQKARSRTYPGIAAAMAEQWGGLRLG